VATSSGGYKLAKPSWRCDFCGYETTEARNLRIHMTSEKHAHNLLALQQSAAAAAAAHANMHHQVGPPLHHLWYRKKGKVFPYSLPSVGPGADPGVQAVSPQVT